MRITAQMADVNAELDSLGYLFSTRQNPEFTHVVQCCLCEYTGTSIIRYPNEWITGGILPALSNLYLAEGWIVFANPLTHQPKLVCPACAEIYSTEYMPRTVYSKLPELEMEIFYALEWLHHKIRLENNSFSHSLGTLERDVVTAREDYIRKACNLFAYYLIGIAAGEARHCARVIDRSRIKGISKTLNRLAAWEKVDEYTHQSMASALTELFNEHDWKHGGYGGKRWGNIAAHAKAYYNCTEKDLGFLTTWLDTLWGLQHNGGRLFDKGYIFRHSENSLLRMLLNFNNRGFLRVYHLPLKYVNLFARANTIGLEGIPYAVNGRWESQVTNYTIPEEAKKIAIVVQPTLYYCYQCGVSRLTKRSLTKGVDGKLYCKSCFQDLFSVCVHCHQLLRKSQATRFMYHWTTIYACKDCAQHLTLCDKCGKAIAESAEWQQSYIQKSAHSAALAEALAPHPHICESCCSNISGAVLKKAETKLLREEKYGSPSSAKISNTNTKSYSYTSGAESTASDYAEDLSQIAKKSI